MKLAIFDCDGTLVDSQADIGAAMGEAFAAAGLPSPDPGAVRQVVGLSLPHAIGQLAGELDDNQQSQLVAGYKTAFFARRKSGFLSEQLYEGIEPLLRALAGAGWQLAIATGKSQRGLEACLATHDLTDLFASLQTADHHPSKPHPAMIEAALFEVGASPSQAVMIGDTSFDMAMAREAGVRALGVGWGYHPADALLGAGAEAVARDIAELEELL